MTVLPAALPVDEPIVEPTRDQFDFWCGSWVVTHVDDAGVAWEGSNEVAAIEDGKVVEERFSLVAGDGELFTGRSHSVPVPGRGWCQTWVDNAGSYLDFVGGWNGSQMVLERQTTREGAAIRQRMLWYDITPDAFTWDWQSSTDDGQSWQLNWRLAYRRAQQIRKRSTV